MVSFVHHDEQFSVLTDASVSGIAASSHSTSSRISELTFESSFASCSGAFPCFRRRCQSDDL